MSGTITATSGTQEQNTKPLLHNKNKQILTDALRRDKQKFEELTEQFDAEVEAMEDAYDAQTEALKEILIGTRSGNIQIKFFGLGWQPEIEQKD